MILGTGSAAPSKLRASSAIYVELTTDTNSRRTEHAVPAMLLDCGEGAYGQLVRQFDSTEAVATRLQALRCIWISHHHADHQCGLVRVLEEFLRVREDNELFVIAPNCVLTYVTTWFPGLPQGVRLATCDEINDHSSPRRHEFLRHMRAFVSEWRSVRVWHCHDAFGLVCRLVDGRRLVYSGDTKPCDQLVRAGEYCFSLAVGLTLLKN
ncbi:hypothetical protein PINS_up003156 [Pythium insidiosum]|nr:hypothetical protein PINS_up003156 [Pythium insidiosum]